LLVGGITRKPIALCIKSKRCNFCLHWSKNVKNDGLVVPVHDCLKNHDGTSGSMEPIACLDMVTDMYNKKFCIVERICCDDDASTRSMLRWSNADHMKNNNSNEVPKIPISRGKNAGKLQPRPDRGRLPGHIPEPKFVADPNHRRKVLTGELIQLSLAKVADHCTMTRMDSTRLGKGFGYMIRALPNMQQCQYIAAAKAVLEHHFDNHDNCLWTLVPEEATNSRRSHHQ
jgi:hypothetical protein